MNLRPLIHLLFVVVFFILSYNSFTLSRETQVLKADLAELNDVGYGLLSVHDWKRQIDDILFKKIDEFYLDDGSREELKQRVEQMLVLGMDELEKILVTQRENSSSLSNMLAGRLTGWIVDFDKLKEAVPSISGDIIDQLGDEATVVDIKSFIKVKLKEYLDETFGKEDRRRIEEINAKYACIDADLCSGRLAYMIKTNQKQNNLFVLPIIVALFIWVVFMAMNIWKEERKFVFNATLICLSFLLVLGVSTPMIDLDARIDEFLLVFMGSEVRFDNQILFFQSKSILDVVSILMSSPEYSSIMVGVLIFAFSCLLPIGKLLSAFLFINFKKAFHVIRLFPFLLYKTGKWSMADVIVVAIFMAYIGFRGVINNQLMKLEGSVQDMEILTTNNTSLQIGFMLFTVYALVGIYFSSKLQKEEDEAKPLFLIEG